VGAKKCKQRRCEQRQGEGLDVRALHAIAYPDGFIKIRGREVRLVRPRKDPMQMGDDDQMESDRISCEAGLTEFSRPVTRCEFEAYTKRRIAKKLLPVEMDYVHVQQLSLGCRFKEFLNVTFGVDEVLRQGCNAGN
jgi:hypothetical protein